MQTKITYRHKGVTEQTIVNSRTPGSAFATLLLLHPHLFGCTLLSAITIERRSPESAFFRPDGQHTSHKP